MRESSTSSIPELHAREERQARERIEIAASGGIRLGLGHVHLVAEVLQADPGRELEASPQAQIVADAQVGDDVRLV